MNALMHGLGAIEGRVGKGRKAALAVNGPWGKPGTLDEERVRARHAKLLWKILSGESRHLAPASTTTARGGGTTRLSNRRAHSLARFGICRRKLAEGSSAPCLHDMFHLMSCHPSNV